MFPQSCHGVGLLTLLVFYSLCFNPIDVCVIFVLIYLFSFEKKDDNVSFPCRKLAYYCINVVYLLPDGTINL